jgi:hypothetical protein
MPVLVKKTSMQKIVFNSIFEEVIPDLLFKKEILHPQAIILTPIIPQAKIL